MHEQLPQATYSCAPVPVPKLTAAAQAAREAGTPVSTTDARTRVSFVADATLKCLGEITTSLCPPQRVYPETRRGQQLLTPIPHNCDGNRRVIQEGASTNVQVCRTTPVHNQPKPQHPKGVVVGDEEETKKLGV